MPFTSPAALRADLEAADAGPVRGYAVVFASEEAGWVVDWYDDATGIQLPPVKEWLSGARQDHRWFSAFVPARGEHMPAVEDGARVALNLGDAWYELERIGRLQWAPGSTPWMILAGEDDPPPAPARYASG